MFAIIPSDKEVVICLAKSKISQRGNVFRRRGGLKKVDLHFLIEQTLTPSARQRYHCSRVMVQGNYQI